MLCSTNIHVYCIRFLVSVLSILNFMQSSYAVLLKLCRVFLVSKKKKLMIYFKFKCLRHKESNFWYWTRPNPWSDWYESSFIGNNNTPKCYGTNVLGREKGGGICKRRKKKEEKYQNRGGRTSERGRRWSGHTTRMMRG